MIPIVGALLGQGLNLLANAALAKGKDWVEQKTGVKIPDGNVPPEIAAQLKIKEMEHEEELLKIRQEDNRLEAEIHKMYVDDTKDARKREAEIAVAPAAPLFNKIITPLLACFIVGLSFLIFGVLIFGGDIPVSRKDVIIYLLGILSAALLQVLNYYFGTSQGSTHSSQLFRDIIRKDNAGR